MITDEWAGCYPSNWKGMIVPDAIAHPAKFSSKLIRRIYGHMKAEGWVKPGDTVVDPFGGVALGALDAMRLGLRWFGIELEPRFVKLGNENIQLWYRRFSSMPIWNGDAVLLNGDSRELVKVLKEAGALDPRSAVSSPPYAETINSESNGIEWEKAKKDYPGRTNHKKRIAMKNRIANNMHYSQVCVSSPPYVDQDQGGNRRSLTKYDNSEARSRGYSQAAISSPPYADSMNKPNGIDPDKIKRPGGLNSQSLTDSRYSAVVSSPPFMDSMVESGDPNYAYKFHDQKDYGTTPGQLGAMKANGFEAAVSSPPFGGSELQDNRKTINDTIKGIGRNDGQKPHAMLDRYFRAYTNDENLGAVTGDDFWTAARAIIDQVYQVLAPGGHACRVVKSFVKNKERVDFPGQWRQMCEAAGFATLHEHHALLVHSTATDFEGNEKRRESKSFFRRLAENKGSPRIDWEVVYCMVKQ